MFKCNNTPVRSGQLTPHTVHAFHPVVVVLAHSVPAIMHWVVLSVTCWQQSQDVIKGGAAPLAAIISMAEP